jgi:hypothetical protein
MLLNPGAAPDSGCLAVGGVALAKKWRPPAKALAADHPCQALYEAARAAARAWIQHGLNWPMPSGNPVYDAIQWREWMRRMDELQAAYKAAMKALNDCLAGLRLPPLKNPTEPLPPAPATPPTTPPLQPASSCPLDNSYPPPAPSPGSAQEPCYNQLQNNILICDTCRQNGTSSETYGDCIERAKALFRDCKKRSGAPGGPAAQ